MHVVEAKDPGLGVRESDTPWKGFTIAVSLHDMTRREETRGCQAKLPGTWPRHVA